MATRKGKLRIKSVIFAIYPDFFGEKKERPDQSLFSIVENGKEVIGPPRFPVVGYFFQISFLGKSDFEKLR